MEWLKQYQNPLNSSLQGFIRSNDAWLRQYSINASLQSLLESNSSWLKQYQNPLNSSLQSFIRSNDALLKQYSINASLQSLLESNSSWLKQYQNPLNSSLQSFIRSNDALLKQYESTLTSSLSQYASFGSIKREADLLGEYFKTSGRISVDQEFIETIQVLTETTSQRLGLETEKELQDIAALIPVHVDIDGAEKLSDYLKQVPEKARVIFLWIFYRVLVFYVALLIEDIFVGVVSDKVKPVVSDYLFGKPAASNKEISGLSRTMPDIEFTNIRFVSVEGLYVRRTPNSKGEVIDRLPRAEVVTLVTKSENLSWSLIRYKNQDDEVMQGWVFSRYLQRFR